MSMEIVRKIQSLVEELGRAVNEYKSTNDPQKRFDLLLKISRLQTQIQLLLTELTTL